METTLESDSIHARGNEARPNERQSVGAVLEISQALRRGTQQPNKAVSAVGDRMLHVSRL